MAVLMNARSTDGFDAEGVTAGDGSDKQLTVYGTAFGAGEVILEVSTNDTNWVPLTINGVAAVITEFKSMYMYKIGHNIKIRARMQGADGTTDNVNVEINT